VTIGEGPSPGAAAPWTLLTLEAPRRAEEEISRALCRLGALGVQVLEAGAGAAEGSVTLRAWFDAGRPLPGPGDLRAACPDSGATILSVAEVADGRWVERWMETLGPIAVGAGVTIVPVPDADAVEPAWPARDGRRGGRLTLRIVPGRAFGTGEHPTTQLCLEALEREGVAGRTVLDVGTGSGILAIAAAALGCRRAIGIDVDGEALRAARRNVLINAAGSRVALVHAGPGAVGARFDRVVANLSAGPLEGLAGDLLERASPEGALILGGMLEAEAGATAEVYRRAGSGLLETTAREGWACLVRRARRA
jgi:ribosomal protein L11 methyltransferase